MSATIPARDAAQIVDASDAATSTADRSQAAEVRGSFATETPEYFNHHMILIGYCFSTPSLYVWHISVHNYINQKSRLTLLFCVGGCTRPLFSKLYKFWLVFCVPVPSRSRLKKSLFIILPCSGFFSSALGLLCPGPMMAFFGSTFLALLAFY